jgi:hypothetical protein
MCVSDIRVADAACSRLRWIRSVQVEILYTDAGTHDLWVVIAERRGWPVVTAATVAICASRWMRCCDSSTLRR